MANASPSCPPAQPVTVVGPQFTLAYLIMTKKLMTLAEGTFSVTDVNGAVMFKVKGFLLTLHDRRLLLDNADNPIISLRQKFRTAHRRWQVFRGDSHDEKDLLLNIKKSSVFQMKTDLDVFVAANTQEEVPDFKIKGSWFERSCTIYLGDTSTIIAQMHRKIESVTRILIGKDTYAVTVYPNVDHALIVTLVLALHEINDDRKDG